AGSDGLLGQLAIVGASLSYATFTTFSRKVIRGEVEPLVLSAIAMLSAALTTTVLSLIGALFFDLPLATPAAMPLNALLALLVLGLVNTFVAYLLFYNIVRVLGAARAAMVTYIVPVVGLCLGVLFLGETLDLFIIGGAALIFTGIGIVNIRRLPFRRIKAAGAAAD
nr:DMT family transporter [Anaerolineae bacterium]